MNRLTLRERLTESLLEGLTLGEQETYIESGVFELDLEEMLEDMGTIIQ